jgi:hypothetical protein
MISSTSSTVDASSDIDARVVDAIKKASSGLSQERTRRLEELRRRVERLDKRGLLKKQTYSSSSAADFKRLYSFTLA